jgi:hypothetical protein
MPIPTTQDNEKTSPAMQTTPPPIPDGTSELPSSNLDYPTPGGTDSSPAEK